MIIANRGPAVCDNVSRVGFEPKNIERPVHISHPKFDELNSFMHHEIVLATLPCGTAMALDATGAEFGWKETVSPWISYQQSRVGHIEYVETVQPKPLAGAKFVKPDIGSGFTHSLGSVPEHVRGLVESVAGLKITKGTSPDGFVMEAVVRALVPQIQARYGGVKGLLQLTESEFAAARTAVVAAAKRGLSLLVDEARTSPHDYFWNRVALIWDSSEQDQQQAAEPRAARGRGARTSSAVRDSFLGGLEIFRDSETGRRLWKARWDKTVKIEMPSQLACQGGH